ncbi:MAG TPA: winged helix-turn-helix domain-containing protein [Gammaproteobacteria bacterium]|nr:winged helix-turn-helix domain-containing protein [Gammaproteobacteria bacterium]
MEDRLPRRLAAILYADVVGYSRLTVDDEDATHRILRRYLDFITETIGYHNGQIMHFAGDAVLARFDAVVDALVSAIGIQQQIEKLNQELPESRRTCFRIGLNLGDVIEDRGDIYGDGVNIAARLESLADPGGICVSEAVRTAAKSRLDLEYEAMGEQDLKNISEPVRAYRVRFGAESLAVRDPSENLDLEGGPSIEPFVGAAAADPQAAESPESDSAQAPAQADTDAASGRFRVADWAVDPQRCLISRGDESVKLEPKVMDLLVYLASSPGRVHARDELLEQVWRGTVVSDEALTNAIIKLRKAFGDDARHPRVVETLSKRGYRLVADVAPIEPPAPADPSKESAETGPASGPAGRNRPAAFPILAGVVAIALAISATWYLARDGGREADAEATAPGILLPEEPSIAVLPFVNDSNEPEYNYFSDGIWEDLITDLSSLSGLFVISRNSTVMFKGRVVDIKQVASELGVRFVLEGSVRRSGERVRVNVRLIDGSSGGQLWAERYDGKLQNVFELQDRITARVIAALEPQLTGRETPTRTRVETDIPEAYDEFLKGWSYRWQVSRDNYAEAERHFLRALELDPDYARPRAALALIYWSTWDRQWHINASGWYGGWMRAQEQLDMIADTPLPLAHSIRAQMSLYNRRFDEALREAQVSIDLNPNSPTGYLALAEVQAYSGFPEASIDSAGKGLRRDPNFPAPYLFVEGRALFDLRRYDQAVATLERAVAANPSDYYPLVILVAAYGYLGKQEEASQVVERIDVLLRNDQLPEFTVSSLRNRWPYKDRTQRLHLVEGIRHAGVPEW